MTMYVQFSDTKKTLIASWFSAPQDPKTWPGVVAIEADDPRYAAYVASLPVGARIGLPAPT